MHDGVREQRPGHRIAARRAAGRACPRRTIRPSSRPDAGARSPTASACPTRACRRSPGSCPAPRRWCPDRSRARAENPRPARADPGAAPMNRARNRQTTPNHDPPRARSPAWLPSNGSEPGTTAGDRRRPARGSPASRRHTCIGRRSRNGRDRPGRAHPAREKRTTAGTRRASRPVCDAHVVRALSSDRLDGAGVEAVADFEHTGLSNESCRRRDGPRAGSAGQTPAMLPSPHSAADAGAASPTPAPAAARQGAHMSTATQSSTHACLGFFVGLVAGAGHSAAACGRWPRWSSRSSPQSRPRSMSDGSR